jgi:CBS domain-containing membrane protein
MQKAIAMKARRQISRAENTVTALMRRHFVSVGPAESLLDADRIMRLARIRHLPVVEAGRLVGVLSHRDVLDASIARLEQCEPGARADYLRGITIAEVMHDEPYTALENTTLGDAARRMLRLKIGFLPVIRRGTDGEQLIGLVTESDLLRAAYAPDFDEASD